MIRAIITTPSFILRGCEEIVCCKKARVIPRRECDAESPCHMRRGSRVFARDDTLTVILSREDGEGSRAAQEVLRSAQDDKRESR